MKKLFTAIFLTAFAFSAFAQEKKTPELKENAKESKVQKSLNDLAEKALKAHGGEKLRKMKTLTMIGDVDVTASVFQQEIPATFVTIFAGDKYRLEINNPFQPLKQTFDGQRTYTNLDNGFTLPSPNQQGFWLIPKIGDEGFEILALPENKKKKKGFRLISPLGDFTDFYLDKKTNQVEGWDATFYSNRRMVTTSVEIDKLKEVDGVVLPEKYAQRFDLQQMTIWAEFKATQIVVNKEISDEIFQIK